MLLTEARLRTLIRNILLEGAREDAAALAAQLEGDNYSLPALRSLTPRWIVWLADRYLRKKYPVYDSLPDVLPLVSEFESKAKAISEKYLSAVKSEDNKQFKTAVDLAFPPESRGWQNPSDATKMSSSDLSLLLSLYRRKKQRYDVDRSDVSWQKDKVGQFGPWSLYFPTSQENSINIAGADPVTLKPYTTWCTARTDGSNLFYQYVASEDIIFYAIDESKPATDPHSRISLGYTKNHEDEDEDRDEDRDEDKTMRLYAGGENGSITVDAKNDGLVMSDLKRIFGEHLAPINDAALRVINRHGEKHPSNKILDDAAKDVTKFKKILSNLSDREAGWMVGCILGKRHGRSPSSEVLAFAARHKIRGARMAAAESSHTPLESLLILANDKDLYVLRDLAGNRNTPPEILDRLASHESEIVDYALLLNPNTQASTIRRIDDNDRKNSLDSNKVYHKNTPPDVLDKVFDRLPSMKSSSIVRRQLAKHANTRVDTLERLLSDEDDEVREAAIMNVNTPYASAHCAALEILLRKKGYTGVFSRLKYSRGAEMTEFMKTHGPDYC